MNHSFFSEAQSTTNKQKPLLENNDRNSRIRIAKTSKLVGNQSTLY
jgi:hypothetical protein